MVILRLALPWPPSTNALYATVRGSDGTSCGRRILSRAGRLYKADVIDQVAVAKHQEQITVPAVALALTLDLHPPNKRSGDTSNRVKLIEDSIAAGLQFDDRRFDRVTAERREPWAEHPAVVATVETMEGGVLE